MVLSCVPPSCSASVRQSRAATAGMRAARLTRRQAAGNRFSPVSLPSRQRSCGPASRSAPWRSRPSSSQRSPRAHHRSLPPDTRPAPGRRRPGPPARSASPACSSRGHLSRYVWPAPTVRHVDPAPYRFGDRVAVAEHALVNDHNVHLVSPLLPGCAGTPGGGRSLGPRRAGLPSPAVHRRRLAGTGRPLIG